MGKTIVISSHILHELAELCNVVGIIERGTLVYSGTVASVMRRAKLDHIVEVGVEARVREAGELLRAVPGVTRVAVIDGDGLEVAGDAAPPPGALLRLTLHEEAASGGTVSDLPNRLINAGFRLTRLAEEPVNLETAFMRLTKGLVQ